MSGGTAREPVRKPARPALPSWSPSEGGRKAAADPSRCSRWPSRPRRSAGAVLVQKVLDGPVAQGDALGRWLQLSSLVGIFPRRAGGRALLARGEGRAADRAVGRCGARSRRSSSWGWCSARSRAGRFRSARGWPRRAAAKCRYRGAHILLRRESSRRSAPRRNRGPRAKERVEEQLRRRPRAW